MNNVSIGPSTIAGWIAAICAAILPAVAFIEGNETLLAGPGKWSANLSALLLIVTHVGRYAQALRPGVSTLEELASPPPVTPQSAVKADPVAVAPAPLA